VLDVVVHIHAARIDVHFDTNPRGVERLNVPLGGRLIFLLQIDNQCLDGGAHGPQARDLKTRRATARARLRRIASKRRRDEADGEHYRCEHAHY